MRRSGAEGEVILGSDVRAELGVAWPLIPSVDDGAQKRTVKPWKHLQDMPAGRPYDHLRAEMWSVPTGAGIGVVVLDFDGTAGDVQRMAWNLTSPHVRTGSGGHHVYVAHPGWSVRTYSGDGTGVDVRGDGGVAHVAGSSRKGPYEVLRPLSEPLAWASVCPGARAVILRRRVAPVDTRAPGWGPGPGYTADLIRLNLERFAEASEGGRNQALNRVAWSLGRQRVALEDVLPALLGAAETAGLGEQEAASTIRSGWRSGFGA